MAKPKRSVSWRFDPRRRILHIVGSNFSYDMRITRMIVAKYLKHDPDTILYQQGWISPLIRIIRGRFLRDFLSEDVTAGKNRGSSGPR
jgi:hypothetical protein